MRAVANHRRVSGSARQIRQNIYRHVVVVPSVASSAAVVVVADDDDDDDDDLADANAANPHLNQSGGWTRSLWLE